MAKAPAVVIIVRHGARLDAADKSWHLTSPTPYDPPLTYGGWVQSRALGLRIASLLHARERDAENAGSSPLADSSPFAGAADALLDKGKAKRKDKKRKHKVIIHSSPFQRCVQTSVGISAGLSQYKGHPASTRKSSDQRLKTVSQLHSASPRLSAVDSPRLESIPEPYHNLAEPKDAVAPSSREHAQQQPPSPPEKPTLRVDAFLGEWLSPDYFEMITHPPNSTMMVASAKSSLIRKGENIDHFVPTAPKATGMWGTPAPGPATPSPVQDTQPDNRPSPSRAVPRRDRASSYSSVTGSPSKASNGRSSPSPFRSQSDPSNPAYVPPTPTYAVSPADPIPRGYVAHAKDACIEVDQKWDSMRGPQYWGDGGSYGEEWSSMHKRFRKGLHSMVQWYSEDFGEGDSDAAIEGSENKDEDGEEEDDDDDDDDDDTDLALVLVTHGAGCNALIGALTGQPVLIDVGMASLTMAVKKDGATFSTPSSGGASPSAEDSDRSSRARPPVRRNSTDLGLATMYDLKVVASSEHLRPGIDPANASIPAPSSPRLSSQKAPDYRRRYKSAASHAAAGLPVDTNWNTGEPGLVRSASTVGPSGMRRGSIATAAPQKMRTYSLAAAAQVQSALEEMKIHTNSPSGLWSSPIMEKPPSPSQDFLLDGSNSPDASKPSSRPSSAVDSRISSASNSQKASPQSTPSGSLTPADKEALEEEAEVERESESAISDLPAVGSALPHSLGRSLSQKGLWGSAPSGFVSRETGVPKRRWTLQQEN